MTSSQNIDPLSHKTRNLWLHLISSHYKWIKCNNTINTTVRKAPKV